MLPDWIKTDVYNAVIELQETMISREQDGIIVISRGQAYFKNNENIHEVLFQKEKKNKSRIILEKANKYKDDLLRFEIDPYPDINEPYDNNDDILTKICKIIQMLKQHRTVRDRVRTLVYYYLLGKILMENGQQHLKSLDLSGNQSKKLILKSTRAYNIFRKVGKFQIYNTRIISIKILTEMSKEQFDNLLESLTVSQELNA